MEKSSLRLVLAVAVTDLETSFFGERSLTGRHVFTIDFTFFGA